MSALDALLTPAEASELLGITDRQVRGLASRGAFPKASRGRYRLADLVPGYLRSLAVERARQKGGAAESEFRKLRSAEMQARLDERTSRLEAEAKGAAYAVVDDAIGTLRAAMSAIPARSTRDIAIRATIEKEIDNAFDAVADHLEAQGRVGQPRRDDQPVKAAKPPRRVGRKKPRVSAVKRKARAT